MRTQSILALLIILLIFGGIYYFSNSPKPVEKPDPQTYVWDIDMDEIEHITLSLPREGLSESFIKISKEDTFPWYFDDEERTEVDRDRWGGGIPLLLSGPGADRVIAEHASPEKLAEFGLDEPALQITLTLNDGSVMNIDVGDSAPSMLTYYVRAPNTSDVAIVDASWYQVLEGIVKDPPYAPPPEEE
ncbi:DUF4340 domain-containing protein [Chloroflexota bacterium]